MAYKKDQGRFARMSAFWALLFLFGWGCLRPEGLVGSLRSWIGTRDAWIDPFPLLGTHDLPMAIAIGAGVVIGIALNRILNRPPIADLLIETESELRKVTWPTPGDTWKGTLAVMASCPPALFQTLKPMLEVLGKVFYLGEKPGLGQTMKLCNNLLSATALAITSEAMVMGVKAGLDPRTMLDVINAGSGRNSASQDKFPKAILPRTFDFGFTNELMYKDVKLFLQEAEALGIPMWVASAVGQLWSLANSQIGPQADFTTIVQCVEKWAGVEVKAPGGA